MTNDQLLELNNLAHEMAYEFAKGILESSSYDGDWLECVVSEQAYGRELHYLDLRGLLVRNADNPRLFRILDPEVQA